MLDRIIRSTYVRGLVSLEHTLRGNSPLVNPGSSRGFLINRSSYKSLGHQIAVA